MENYFSSTFTLFNRTHDQLSSGWVMPCGVLNLNTLRPGQDGRHFADDIFMCILFNENCCILIKFSLKYVPKGPIDNNPTLVQIMAWRRSGDKPFSEPMMISLPTHICVTRPQWVNSLRLDDIYLSLIRVWHHFSTKPSFTVHSAVCSKYYPG